MHFSVLRSAGLLAENDFFKALHDAVSNGPSTEEVISFWSGAVLLAILVGFGIRYATRRDGPKLRPQRDYLTAAVDLLGLSEEDRRDLRYIAGQAGLPQPAAILLSP